MAVLQRPVPAAAHRVAGALVVLALVVSAIWADPGAAQAASAICQHGATVCRVSGAGRVETAVQVSAQYWDTSPHALLATSRDFPDALAGGALAAKRDAPLLLTHPTRLSPLVAEELSRLHVRDVTILGGPGAVAPAVEAELIARGLRVHRLRGANRFATAAAIADTVGASPSGDVVLALGQHPRAASAWPDAVASGALAATPDRVPTLLTGQTELPADTVKALAALNPETVIVVGGPNAVPEAIARRVAELGYDVRRLAGASRYETSAVIASEALSRFPSGERPIIFAGGSAFPDALSATALAARLEAPLLLVPQAALPSDAAWQALMSNPASPVAGGVVVGGPAMVSDPVVAQLNTTVTSQVAAGISLSPDSVPPGAEVTVTGHGFPPSTSGLVGLTDGVLSGFRTDDTGAFTSTITVGGIVAGLTTVTATADLHVAVADFTVTEGDPLGILPGPEPEPTPEEATPPDALGRRLRAELAVFTDWLEQHNVPGYIGEVAWPNHMTADMDRWNALASGWYADAAAADLWVTAWATGEWWPRDHYNSIYIPGEGSSVLDTARPQAPVLEGQSRPEMRGINVAGAEFGAPGSGIATSDYSNVNPGTYGTHWKYDTQASFEFLASRGVTQVRLPFRWERIQPTLGGPFDSAELTRLTQAVADAHGAGLGVILDVHNYGGYFLDDGTQGVRRAIGSAEVPLTHFNDLWRRLSLHFKDNPGVIGYGLMNEPVDMPALAGGTAAQQWERASQQALNAIRATGDKTTVLVPGYLWSGAWRWTSIHAQPWITDPVGNYRYEAHHYFDRNRSSWYDHTYDEEVADAVAKGY